MAFYAEEEEGWKCLKHPSKRRRTGICPTCLRERLGKLCPDCGNVRPCECYAIRTTSSSSSCSSSFSMFSSSSSTAGSVVAVGVDGVGSVGRVRSLIDIEPAFRRSRSVEIPFLRSRSKNMQANSKAAKTPSFWSVLKSKRRDDFEIREREESKENDNSSNINNNKNGNNYYSNSRIHDFERMMLRSRSVSASMTSAGDVRSSPAKGKGWHFPSPMKVFRQKSLSKVVQVVQDRSPLNRG